MIQLNNPIWGKLNTLSPSRINKYLSCGFQFQCNYIWEMRPPGGINLARGKAVHKAAEADNRNFIDNRTRLDFDTLIQIADEKFDEILLKEGVFIPKSKEGDKDKIISKARAETIASVKLYVEMEKNWTPVSTEENYTIDIGYPLPTNCYLDMVDETNCIWDWKTQAKRGTIQAGIQDMFYSKAYYAKWGVYPSFKYGCFILTTKPYIDIQVIEPIQDYSILDRYVEAYFAGVENNVFLPASKFDYMCSESMCPFHRACPFKTNQK